MRHVKTTCKYLPPSECDGEAARQPRDWEAHPSWIAGMEALEHYGDWVSSVVMPIAFQWIEEHKAEVYATVPEELKDDVGAVLAAAFKLVRELPAYKAGQEKDKAYEEAVEDGTWDPSNTNPTWTRIVTEVRDATQDAFDDASDVLGDLP